MNFNAEAFFKNINYENQTLNSWNIKRRYFLEGFLYSYISLDSFRKNLLKEFNYYIKDTFNFSNGPC